MGTPPAEVSKARLTRVRVRAFQSMAQRAREKVWLAQALLKRPMTWAGSPGMAANETSLQLRGPLAPMVVSWRAPFSPRKNSARARSCCAAAGAEARAVAEKAATVSARGERRRSRVQEDT